MARLANQNVSYNPKHLWTLRLRVRGTCFVWILVKRRTSVTSPIEHLFLMNSKLFKYIQVVSECLRILSRSSWLCLNKTFLDFISRSKDYAACSGPNRFKSKIIKNSKSQKIVNFFFDKKDWINPKVVVWILFIWVSSRKERIELWEITEILYLKWSDSKIKFPNRNNTHSNSHVT